MKHNIYIIICLLLITAPRLSAQEEMKDVMIGNFLYKQKQYIPAEIEYRRGLNKNSSSFEANFNLGNTLMEQHKWQDAATQYERTVRVINPKKEKQKAAYTYHNLGNAYMQTGDFDKAVEAYKSSLRLNPKDDDTRYNLVKAMQLQQLQPQQKEQQQQEQQQKEQQEQQQKEQREQQKEERQEQQMDKETAERLLEALEQNEIDTQEKMQQQKGGKRNVEKDW